jgi:antitoxin (DNA-binding transcriptional repressor) of toxin-antitoxin stability system
MSTITVHKAKTNLSRYIEQALAGKDVVIGRNGKAEVRLVKIVAKPFKRQFGQGEGTAWMADDAFSSEVDKEIADLMYGDGSI